MKRYVVLSLLIAVCACTIPAFARTVKVNCPHDSITAALRTLDPDVSNQVMISGVCSENVVITGFSRLSIVSATAARATVQDANGGNPTVVFAVDDSHVTFQNLNIRGGASDVFCFRSSICNFKGNDINESTRNGILLDHADADLDGDIIENNTGGGMVVFNSRARMNNVTVRNTLSGSGLPGHGIDADYGSTITFGQATVTDNQGAGINLVGSVLMHQWWAGNLQISRNAGGGIWVTEQSTGGVSGATVTDNGTSGVIITGNSEADFWSGGTFTGNQNIDVYCSVNGVGAGLQNATVGNTNCPNPY
jgi:hypothetical protein